MRSKSESRQRGQNGGAGGKSNSSVTVKGDREVHVFVLVHKVDLILTDVSFERKNFIRSENLGEYSSTGTNFLSFDSIGDAGWVFGVASKGVVDA